MLSTVRHNSTLSASQSQVIAALAAGRSIAAAAREAGVHRSTIHLWVNNQPPFAEALADAQQETRDHLDQQTRDLSAKAFDTIRQILDDPKASPSVRLRAALAVLERKREWFIPLSTEIRTAEAGPEPEPEPQVDSAPGIPRNSSCPCGSGLKHKRCCGRSAPAVLGPCAATARAPNSITIR
jgi:transposase